MTGNKGNSRCRRTNKNNKITLQMQTKHKTREPRKQIRGETNTENGMREGNTTKKNHKRKTTINDVKKERKEK